MTCAFRQIGLGEKTSFENRKVKKEVLSEYLLYIIHYNPGFAYGRETELVPRPTHRPNGKMLAYCLYDGLRNVLID